MAHRTKLIVEVGAAALIIAAVHFLAFGRDIDLAADAETPGPPGGVAYSPLGRAGAPMQQDDVCTDPICSSLNSGALL